jgi:small subunit ribosomal protein S18
MMKRRRIPTRRKTCRFCEESVSQIDYRSSLLQDFVTEKGRIVPGKVSGVCARHQRRLARAIKTARSLALLPYNP